jgi:hypothetical protein
MIIFSIGVDPGKSGCIFIEDFRYESGVTVVERPQQIPNLAYGSFPTRYKIIDNSVFVHQKEFSTFHLMNAFMTFLPSVCAVTIERVHDMPGNQGMFNFGQGFMGLKCAFAAHNIPYALVEPQSWKSFHKIPKGLETAKSKQHAIKKVLKDTPELEPYISRVQDHDRAEARLIQLCGLHTYRKLETAE